MIFIDLISTPESHNIENQQSKTVFIRMSNVIVKSTIFSFQIQFLCKSCYFLNSDYSSIEMKLLQSTQGSFAFLGITLDQSVQRNPLNERILAAFSTYVLRIGLYNVFLFRDANTFLEYIENIWLNSAAILVLIGFVVEVLNMDKIFALIDNCVTIVAEGEQTQNNTFTLNNFISNGKLKKNCSRS